MEIATSFDKPSLAVEQRQLMIVHPDELVFIGRMGDVPLRSMGSITVYCAMERPFRFRLSGQPWEERTFAVVPPFIEHEFAADTQRMAAVMIESETVDYESWLSQGHSQTDFQLLGEHLASLYQEACEGSKTDRSSDGRSWRKIAFGGALAPRELDPRISAIVCKVKQEPWRRFSGQECARQIDVSTSRFLHLFSEQTGTSFRRFVAWKRARRVLEQLNERRSMTDIALETGYPDSSHFSHSIRQVYGLQPRDMFARCSQINLYVGQ